MELHAELSAHRLEVVLIPAPDPRHRNHKVRCVQDQNPRWYQSLCDRHQSSRRRRSFKSDTRIRREHTLRALERIAGGDTRGSYAERLAPYVEAKVKELRGCSGKRKPPALETWAWLAAT
jgi:hypothetical protein